MKRRYVTYNHFINALKKSAGIVITLKLSKTLLGFKFFLYFKLENSPRVLSCHLFFSFFRNKRSLAIRIVALLCNNSSLAGLLLSSVAFMRSNADLPTLELPR